MITFKGKMINQQKLNAKIAKVLGPKLERAYDHMFGVILDFTPVNTGRMLSNWVCSMDKPDHRNDDEIKSPTMVEPTNELPLGVEGRRGANEQKARNSRTAVNFKVPWKVFYIANGTPHAADVEFGTLPDPTTFNIRNAPLGTMKRAYDRTKLKFKNL